MVKGSAKWWATNGPFRDPMLNALHHLARFNFLVTTRKVIIPPRGQFLNPEDRAAIKFLVAEYGFIYEAGFEDATKPVKIIAPAA